MLNGPSIPQGWTELLVEGDGSLGQAAGALGLRPRCLHAAQPSQASSRSPATPCPQHAKSPSNQAETQQYNRRLQTKTGSSKGWEKCRFPFSIPDFSMQKVLAIPLRSQLLAGTLPGSSVRRPRHRLSQAAHTEPGQTLPHQCDACHLPALPRSSQLVLVKPQGAGSI